MRIADRFFTLNPEPWTLNPDLLHIHQPKTHLALISIRLSFITAIEVLDELPTAEFTLSPARLTIAIGK